MKRRGLLRTVCLAALLMAAFVCGAQAGEMSQSGSIALTWSAGGDFWLYQVGEVSSESGGLRLTREFADSGVSLDELNDSQTAQRLAEYAQAHPELSHQTATADEKGRARFDGLNTGLYLVTRQAGEGERMVPFLVMLPMRSETDGSWVYAVEAYPKAEPTDTPAPSQTPAPTEPPTDPNLPQTGLPRWPIPVLAGTGLLLFAVGWALCFAGKRHE